MRVRTLARQVYPRELTNVCGAANGRLCREQTWEASLILVDCSIQHCAIVLIVWGQAESSSCGGWHWFQVIMPGPIGFYVAYAMALGMPATAARNEIPFIIIHGGAVIGVLTWISGLIADRMSLTGLVLTIALSMLGLLSSYLLIEAVLLAPLWAPRLGAREQPVVPLILIYAALAAPLAGAMAGYYLPWRRPRAHEQ